MQQKKIVLEKTNEFFIWKETMMGKLNHAEFQFDTNQAKTDLTEDLSKYSEEIRQWQENISSIECLLQQSKTTIPGPSISDHLKQLELKLASIQ